MTFLLLALGFAIAVATLVTYRPIRREPWSLPVFVLAWLPGELPLQCLVVDGVLAGLLASHGGLEAWWGCLGLVLCAGTAVALAGLAVVAHRSGHLVDRAFDEASGPPLRTPEGFDPTPSWMNNWRVALAVPFRFRSVRRIKDIAYDADGLRRHRLDVLVRRGPRAEKAPVLVYVHGGAWIIGEKREQGIPMMHELACRGWVCVAINYRLSPKATWPDHIVDVKRALAWVHQHIADYGGDPDFVAISGGSAGGQLCALAALTAGDPTWQKGFEDGDTSVAACLPFYGVHDMTGDPAASGLYGNGLLELLEDRVMKVSIRDEPQVFASASPEQRVHPGAPPMFVFQGRNDTLVPPVVARRLADRLRETSKAPVVYLELPCTQHAFDVLLSIRSRHTTMGAVRFLESVRHGRS